MYEWAKSYRCLINAYILLIHTIRTNMGQEYHNGYAIQVESY